MRIAGGRRALLPLAVLLALSFGACSSSAGTPGIAANPAAPGAGGEDPYSKGGLAPLATPAANATPAQAAAAGPMIVKTGSLELQVSNPEASASQAEGIVTAAGGYVAAASRSGSEEALSISVTYRIPVAKWQTTLDAIHHASGGGTLKIVSEQIRTEDVTASAVDMDAHLTNLRATEQSLLGIMAKASSIPDTLAVEGQLTTIRGQIEALAAQRNKLGDQAAYSTLSVLFVATPSTQTTSATTNWSVNGTIDDATATLVKLGQAFVSLAIWLLIVGVPIGVVVLVAFLAYRVLRRLRRRFARPTTTG